MNPRVARSISPPMATQPFPVAGGNLARSLSEAPSIGAGLFLFTAQKLQKLGAQITNAGGARDLPPYSARAALHRQSSPAESSALPFPLPQINHVTHWDGSHPCCDEREDSRSAVA